MKSSIFKICLFLSIALLFGCSTGDGSRVVIVTNQGSIELQLYEKTPEHTANFIKLAREGYYDGLLFHKVIKEFIIQGGDTEGSSFTIPAEIVPEYIHKRGALAAYRLEDQFNPSRASSGTQFYIVHGKVYSDYELDQVEIQIAEGYARDMYYQYYKEEEAVMLQSELAINLDSVDLRATRRASAWLLENPYKMRAEAREIYKTVGGFPLLDGEYTVFGEVIKGFEVINKIAEFETDYADRPKIDVKIRRIRMK